MSDHGTAEKDAHRCDLPGCDGTRLGHDLACDFPEETRRIDEAFDRLRGRLKTAPRNLPGDVTDSEGTGSDQHESNEQPPQPVSQEPPVPGVQQEGGDLLRSEPRHGVGGVPVVRAREYDGPADIADR